MSKGINKVILIGHVGRDPEQKIFENEQSMVSLSLATSDKWTDKTTGEQKTNTEWHRVVFFKKLANIVSQYVKKGSHIYVEGSLKTRQWLDKDGNKKYSTEIIGQTMQMLDKIGASESKEDNVAPFSFEGSESFDDDIPF